MKYVNINKIRVMMCIERERYHMRHKQMHTRDMSSETRREDNAVEWRDSLNPLTHSLILYGRSQFSCD